MRTITTYRKSGAPFYIACNGDISPTTSTAIYSWDTVKRKSLAIVGGVVLAVLIICAVVWIAPLALVRSWTEVVGDVPSPDGKWDVVLMVRNAGATTDYSTQLSVIPAGA